MNLLQTENFTTKVKCSLPGEGTDVRKPFEFSATFKLMNQQEWEDQIESNTKSEMVEKVLVKVGENVEGGSVEEDGVKIELSPVQVIARHPITCDAAFMHYHLYLTKDSRDAAMNAGQRKNSKRSRG